MTDLSRTEAEIDLVTGTCNRTSFLEQMERKMAQAQIDGTMLGLIFLDLDGFKTINDSLGFQAGDDLLKSFSGDLLKRVSSKTLVARLGGDESAALLDGIHDSEAVRPSPYRSSTAWRPAFISTGCPCMSPHRLASLSILRTATPWPRC